MFSSRARIGFATAAVAFAAYPILRPWSSEASASTFASPWWQVSHLLAMAGFVALAFALRAAAAAPSAAWGGQPVARAETRAWVAVAGLLPYYGAEAFGLAAVGAYAENHGAPQVLTIADDFRYAPLPMACFAVGLIALALVGGRLIHGTWASGGSARLGGMLAGAGLLTFLPQFFTPGPVRVVHGLVLSAGLALLALAPDPAGASAPSQSRSRMKSIAPVSREMSSGSTAGNIAIRN